MKLMVRNTVKDYDTWRPIFDEELVRAKTFGLTLEKIWRCRDDPDEVFFLFDLESREGAERFMADPESAEAGERSGAVDGAAWFVEED